MTNDPELAEKVRLLRSHGEAPRHHHELVDRHPPPRRPAGGDPRGQAAPPRPDWNERRRDAAAALRAGLAGSDLIVSPAPSAADSDHVYHLFVVRSAGARRAARPPRRRGIASAIHYPTPIHLQPAYAELGLGPGEPSGRRAACARESCSLPIFPAIEDSQIAEIVAAVESFGSPERQLSDRAREPRAARRPAGLHGPLLGLRRRLADPAPGAGAGRTRRPGRLRLPQRRRRDSTVGAGTIALHRAAARQAARRRPRLSRGQRPLPRRRRPQGQRARSRASRFDLVEIHNMPDALVFAALRPKLRGRP